MYMLDTNAASDIIRGGPPPVIARLASVPVHKVAVSVVTQAEMLYGVAKRGHPSGLTSRVREFLARVEVLPWTEPVGVVYGALRARTEAAGVTLSPLDMMIAAHAMESGRVLVTRDSVFGRVEDLQIENWSE